MNTRVEVTPAPFDPEARLAAFRAAAGDLGAVVSFTGVCRADAGAGTRLTLSHYEGYTQRRMAETADRVAERFGLAALLAVHRVGTMAPGEPIVLVATAAAHRRAAFEAADMMMDYLKSAAPLWKKEEGPGGARWVEPTVQDRKDRERWEA